VVASCHAAPAALCQAAPAVLCHPAPASREDTEELIGRTDSRTQFPNQRSIPFTNGILDSPDTVTLLSATSGTPRIPFRGYPDTATNQISSSDALAPNFDVNTLERRGYTEWRQ